MKIVRLEELGPELLFTQLGRNILNMLLLHRRISLENGFNDVGGEIVLQPVGPVRLWLDLSKKGACYAHLNNEQTSPKKNVMIYVALVSLSNAQLLIVHYLLLHPRIFVHIFRGMVLPKFLCTDDLCDHL